MADRHLLYGGSTADIWLNCFGWASLIQQVPKRPVGMPAHEGTAQHACMERLLQDPELGPDAMKAVKVTTEGGVIEITDDHVEAIGVALAAWEDIVDTFPEDAQMFSERFVVMGGNVDDPNEDRGGTTDAAITDGKRAAFVDFKFGQIEVEATGAQNLFYMVCARRTMPEVFGKCETFESYIIQPAYDPPISKTVYPASALDHAEQEFLVAIQGSKAPQAAHTPGDHCSWCDAKLACPAHINRLATLTAPNHVLDLDTLGELALKLRGWDKWRKEAEERIHHELAHGVPVKGWKYVKKKGERQWNSEPETHAAFQARGVGADKYLVVKTISPNQANEQKLMPKSATDKLTTSVSSGNTIAPDSDRRPAVMPTEALGQALKSALVRR